MQQITLDKIYSNDPQNINTVEYNYAYPTTRYQGSKAKILDWLWADIKDMKFNTLLDLFGGTGCVSHMIKTKGKSVIYNDLLKFNYTIGKALIENNSITLTDEDIQYILTKHDSIQYPTIIQDNFQDIFFLDEENVWLDMVVTNIYTIDNEYKRSIAFFALFQACIIKRPYNLFHRANLYVRTQEVKRSFGNKTTWDTPFEVHFRAFVKEANNAIFSNNMECIATNYDAFEFPLDTYKPDVIYIDTPYITSKGVGTDYLDFYHFLEGIMNYTTWPDLLIDKYKHKPILGRGENAWIKKDYIINSFDKLFEKYKDYPLIISYREDGIPSVDELIILLRKYKPNIIEYKSKDYKYALAKTQTKEILLVAR